MFFLTSCFDHLISVTEVRIHRKITFLAAEAKAGQLAPVAGQPPPVQSRDISPPCRLLEELLNKFKSSMHLQLTCFQAAASTVMKT